ncbi:MAG TPA: hypothetical protein VMW72_08570 [Sedimentisphaerales bacterium]|nr:hypothetical protein [Sedimentisphaerales bacterium]
MSCYNVICLLIAMMVVACCSAESSLSQPTSGDRGDYAQPATLPETASSQASHLQIPHPLYPNVLDKQPSISSPCFMENGTEILTAILKNRKYVFIPVTV